MTATATAEQNHDVKAKKQKRKLCIIASKGSLDMAYPPLILANAARMSGIEVHIFFTFWGLDIINKKKIDHLRMTPVGNPSMPMPQLLGVLPGMAALSTAMMQKQIEKLDFPPVSEFIEILMDSGAHIYACKMAMDMMGLTQEDVVDGAEVLGAMEFLEIAEDAQILFV